MPLSPQEILLLWNRQNIAMETANKNVVIQACMHLRICLSDKSCFLCDYGFIMQFSIGCLSSKSGLCLLNMDVTHTVNVSIFAHVLFFSNRQCEHCATHQCK